MSWTDENQLDNSIHQYPGWIADYLKKNREQILREKSLRIYTDAQKEGIPARNYSEAQVQTFNSRLMGELSVQVPCVAEGLAALKAKEEEKQKREVYETQELYFRNKKSNPALFSDREGHRYGYLQKISIEEIDDSELLTNFRFYMQRKLEADEMRKYYKKYGKYKYEYKDIYERLYANYDFEFQNLDLYEEILFDERKFTLRQVAEFAIVNLASFFPNYVKGEPFTYPESLQRMLRSGKINLSLKRSANEIFELPKKSLEELFEEEKQKRL